MISIRAFNQIPTECIELVLKLFNEHYVVRSTFNGTIVDSSLIVSKFHIDAGCAHSIVKYNSKRMKTRSMWDEIQYSLSGTCRIDEAVQNFKVNNNTSTICVISIDRSALKSDTDNTLESHIEQHNLFMNNLFSVLKSYEVSLDQFNSIKSEDISNQNTKFVENIVKCYKLTNLEIETCGLESAVISRIAVKDVL